MRVQRVCWGAAARCARALHAVSASVAAQHLGLGLEFLVGELLRGVRALHAVGGTASSAAQRGGLGLSLLGELPRGVRTHFTRWVVQLAAQRSS